MTKVEYPRRFSRRIDCSPRSFVSRSICRTARDSTFRFPAFSSVRISTAPTDGNSVVLTIDVDLEVVMAEESLHGRRRAAQDQRRAVQPGD